MAIWRGAGGSGDATTDAANEASVASTKAAEAAASATAAASSATSAATEATTATTQASAASTSATNATSSASAASTSETNAATSASNASTSASNAATSATNAATSETNAANSASAAATSASNAATSESNASTSESNAAASAAAALSAFDNFDDKYLGAKASDPTTDNDGDPLVAGALYFNTTSGVMRVYTGSAWVAAYVSATGVLLQANNLSDVASAATSRTNLGLTIGTDVQAHSAVLDATTASYTTAEETKLAGIETAATADQTAGEIKTAYESNADTNAFTDAEQTKLAGIEALADVTDTLNVTAAGALMDSELTSEASVKALDQGVATTDSPSFAGLTVDTNTLHVDSTNDRVGIGTTSPANKLEVTGAIVAQGAVTAYTNTGLYLQNKGSSVVDVGAWRSGASVAELTFSTDSGSDAAPVERMRIDSSGNVGIGTSSPAYSLEVLGDHATNPSALIRSSGSTPNTGLQLEKTQGTGNLGNWDALVINGNDNTSYESRIKFSFDSITTGSIISSQRTGSGETDLRFYTTNAETTSERMRIIDNGNVGIGTASPAATVDVSGNARGAVVTDNDLSFDLSAGNNFSCTPSGAGTLTFTNHLAGQSGFVWLDNSGGHAISAAATTKINAADLTAISTAGVYTLAYFDNGTNAYVSVSRSFA